MDVERPNDHPTDTGGRRRGRGAEAEKRAGALERLKALRQGGRRSDYSAPAYYVKLDEPVFDNCDEDAYQEIVNKRRKEAEDFIENDDEYGDFGYGDDGNEVDWTQASHYLSSDDDGSEGGRFSRKKKVEKKEKKENNKNGNIVSKSSASLSAAAAMMGKQRVSSMFTSSAFNKKGKETDKVKCESIVDDVIKQFAPDESDREHRRRGQSSLLASVRPSKVAPTVVNYVKSEDELVSEGLATFVEKCIETIEVAVVESSELEVEKLEPEVELNVEPAEERKEVKEENVRKLNAKILEEKKDDALSAMAGWKAVKREGNANDSEVGINGFSSERQSEFELDVDGSMPFYILDAHEEFYGANMGTVYLFGKVKVGSGYQSCCVVVKNIQRCAYAIPDDSIFHNDEIVKLEKDAEESKISLSSFRTKLHDMASGLKNEVAKHLLNLNVSGFTMAPVKRRYAFERSDVPVGENYVLKINYPFKDPPLPSDLKGEKFCALLGTHSSALELFLVKRKVKGPSWLLVSKYSTCPAPQRVSWCKYEIVVDSPKDIRVSTSSKKTTEIPPIVVSAINLKTVINERQNVNEIVSASIICCHWAKIDTPMLASEWKKPGLLSHFTVVRKLDGGIFPMGFTKEVTDRNSKVGSNVLVSESSERALLNRLMIELYKLDSDVLVGHNISGFDLDILLHRAQVSYSLTQLSKTQLNKDRKEIASQDIPRMFQTSELLMELIEYGETDAWLSMELMFHLSVLPLTRQLTNISGNLWGKTLQGARAQRVEYLLLHAFHAKKYIVPDKSTPHTKETKVLKRRITHGVEDGNRDDVDNNDVNLEEEAHNERGKGKKGPGYAGGLVLEPKRGLYDKYVLLLDFNSLYPSIIQEYNICFTTAERFPDGLVPCLPSSKTTGVLPELLKNLVQRRRMVKSWMKNSSGIKVQQLDIQQQALKLTANSMYGCLGFSNSRFYAKPLAELITQQGREILQSTVDLVQNNLNLEVIYGDTDSIMVYSGLDDIAKAKAIAGKVIQEVNKKYRCLEIDLDGLYKRMLLLKKKKYAAVKVQFKDGIPYEVVIERKGLDIVRRDWSLLSKELGDFCLTQILSGGSCEDVVESIHNSLMKVQEEMRNGQTVLEKYIITKTLTKPPEVYPDAKNQPHVQVALRMKQSGYSTGCSAGDTIPYIICCEQGSSSSNSMGIAYRARHPDELTKDEGKWMIDIDYYLSQQIHPVVSRLCASIQGTSPGRLADCLGLDSSKFQSKSSEAVSNDTGNALLFAVDDEERYQGCEPLILSCPSCSGTFNCPAVFSSICAVGEKPAKMQQEESTCNFWRTLRCPKCPEEGDMGRMSPGMIANQVKRQVEGFISMYYKGLMTCDDETCKHTTRSVNLLLFGDSEKGTVCPNYPRCNGRLVRKYTEADLYKQLAYFCHLLDTTRCVEKMETSGRIAVEKELAKVRPVVGLAANTVQRIRDRCSFGWVQMNDLIVTF
ncbi:DNA polymerase alpha catalytic subunit [Hibiscus syriacus]|uniref:DNA polymerase n=1 Tax=Hibiscus syriacus TaxID=106335 RepID=A0A6A3C089_HIBSY|nr:DNA polymerase alpha catalytic subunit [Hibiscus syriacus]